MKRTSFVSFRLSFTNKTFITPELNPFYPTKPDKTQSQIILIKR